MGNRLVASLALSLGVLTLFGPSYSEWAALMLIVVAGIPHGSFDLRVAEVQWAPRGWSRLTVLLAYVLVGSLMSALCLLYPTLGLAVFLAISAWHFSEGEMAHSGRLVAVAYGISAIILPIGLHITDARPYLSFFVPEDVFASVEPLAKGIALGLCLSIVVLLAVDLCRGAWEQLPQRAVCLCAWLVLPPLAGFSVWFIGRHSRQHLSQCRELFAGSRLGIPADFVVISILAVALILPLAFRFDLTDINQLFAASIILIAGLTLPHMLVSRNLKNSIQALKSQE